MNNNFCVIMAGGIGSRFWPYSRNARPKQFLDFLGTGRSLIQMTIDRFRSLVPIENMLIVTNVNYRDLILEQLPDLKPTQILLEPARRNTAPCIAYAMARIKSMCHDANIVVAPSDHLVLKEDEFDRVIRKGLDFVAHHDQLLTLGITPTRPETGYGYIQMEPGDTDIRRVKTFTEKPNRELAQAFIESGEFVWNSGMFLWNAHTIENAFRLYQNDIYTKFTLGNAIFGTEHEEAYINEMFPSCPNISIDYGIMEKADNVSVLCADFGWSDLGTWDSLYELSEKDENRNVTMRCEASYYDSCGNFVTMPEGQLAVLDGLNDYIVAYADHVLMICPRSKEQDVRQFVNDAQVRHYGKFN